MRINERRAVVMARLFYRKPFVRMAKIEKLQCALKELVDFFLVDLVWGEEFVEVEVRKTSVGHASGQKLPQAAGINSSQLADFFKQDALQRIVKNTRCRTSVSASACKWQQLSSRETSAESKTRTALNSTGTFRSRSSRCSRSSVECAIKARACGLARGRQRSHPARLPKKFMAKPTCSSDTATVMNST